MNEEISLSMRVFMYILDLKILYSAMNISSITSESKSNELLRYKNINTGS